MTPPSRGGGAGDQLRVRTTLSGCGLRAEAQTSPLWFTAPGLPLPCQPGDSLCPDGLALAVERMQCELCGHLLGPWSPCKKAGARQEGGEGAGAGQWPSSSVPAGLRVARGSGLRISHRSWLLSTCPPPSLVGAVRGSLVSALGVACGAVCFQDADLAVPALTEAGGLSSLLCVVTGGGESSRAERTWPCD